MPLLQELLTDNPASTDDWFERIAILRKAAVRDDLPATPRELARQLQALADAELIEDRGGEWWPTYKVPVAANSQRELFA